VSVPLLLAAPPAASLLAAEGIGTGRLVPTAAAVLGLVGVVAGGLALARSARSAGSRPAAVTALLAGAGAAAVGALHAAASAGGLGTGNGLAGAVVAVVLGGAGLVLGGLALARTRRTGRRAAPVR
jgi:hypothetical protein